MRHVPSVNSGAGFAVNHLPQTKGWRADLTLRFESVRARTVLTAREHSGPLVVQKPLYPEGDAVCHAVIVHPPGGIAGGDELQLRAAVESHAHALLTTPGAGKWYKANGLQARQRLDFSVGDGACLEWLPQETILFDAAQAKMQTRVTLAPDARYAGWEILCFGRRAAGEKFASGALRQSTQIFRGDELVWNESAVFDAGDVMMTSPVGMNGCAVAATFVIAAGAVPQAVVDTCRAVELPADVQYGLSALPEIFVARYLGDSAEQARRYFESLWTVVRPWYAQIDARRPRIWNT